MISLFKSLFRRSNRASIEGENGDAGTNQANQNPNEARDPNLMQELFSADRPIGTPEEDLFCRGPFAERIAQTIASRKSAESLVISIYGPWGDGKTSTLNLMRLSLQKYDDIVCISFNPWYFGSNEQLIRAFFETLAGQLGKSLPTKTEEIGKALKKYGALLSVASISIGGIGISPGQAASEFGASISNADVDDLRIRVGRILRESGKRVVVLIDDIDRLERSEIQSMLKLVKLSASFDYISYVLAFDDEWVSAAIGEKYGHGGIAAGRSFLEKIIQVPLHLPRPDQLALRRLVFSGVEEALGIAKIELSQEDGDAFVCHFIDGIEPVVSTPRQARLYGNALSFAMPILKGEVHPVDHLLIEGVRIFFPRLYTVIRDNPTNFLDGGHRYGRRDDAAVEQTKKLIDDALSEVPIDSLRVGTKLLQPLFPRLASVYNNTEYGSDFDQTWEKQKRIASKQYFSRYFGYGVPPGDVSDAETDDFLTLVRDGETEDIDARIVTFDERGAVANFVRKIRLRESAIERDTAAPLALSIARNGGILPRERGFATSDRSLGQAAILMSKMLLKLGKSNRSDLAREIASIADPIPLACEFWRWTHLSDDEKEEDRLVSVDVEDEMAKIISDRIEHSWQAEPIYRTFGDDAPRLFWYWLEYGDAARVSSLVQQRLDAHTAEMDDLLATYVGTAWGMESGLPHKSDFDRTGYDAVTKVVDPDYILANLRGRYGDVLDDPYYHHGGDTPLGLKFAHQFAYVHSGVLTERDAAAQPVIADPNPTTE